MLFLSKAEEGALEEAIRSDLVTLDGRLSPSACSRIPVTAALLRATPAPSSVSPFPRKRFFSLELLEAWST